MKRTAGVIAAAVGIAGTVLSIVLIVQLWSLAQRLDREAQRLPQRLEQAAGSIRDQADATGALLQTARHRTRTPARGLPVAADRGRGSGWNDRANARAAAGTETASARGFDEFAEKLCASYSEGVGRGSIPPGRYFRMLLIG